jgi:uncharacterized caspase-like protein
MAPADRGEATDQVPARHLHAAPHALYTVHVNRWAIIVGISQYKHERLNLKYAHRDAEELYTLLQTSSGGGFEPERIVSTLPVSLVLLANSQELHKLFDFS